MREPSSTALYLFAAVRDAIDQTTAGADPAVAVSAADRLLALATAMNMQDHRVLTYGFADGPDVLTFTYQVRIRCTSKDDEHSFLLVLRVDGKERDRCYKLFHREP